MRGNSHSNLLNSVFRIGWVAIAFAMALPLAAGYAATQTSDNADGTPSEPSVTLSRSIEAGRAVSSRALSSKAKAANAEAAKTKAAKPELTDFQKKITTIAQGKASGTGNTLSDFATQAAPFAKKTPDAAKASAAKKAVVAKKATAAKALKDEAKEEESVDPNAPKPVKENTKGTVTGISHQGIAIEYAQDKDKGGMEVWIPFSKHIEHPEDLKDLSGLEVGDKVSAVYDEYPNMTKQLTQITLLKKKPKEKESEEM